MQHVNMTRMDNVMGEIEQSFWKSPSLLRNAGDVSIVTTVCASIFEPALFVHCECGTHHLVTLIPVYISTMST